MKTIRYIFLVVLLSITVSCKKYVDVDPPKTELASEGIFVTDRAATAAVMGIYTDMNSYNYFYANIVTMFMGGMNADEFTYALTSTAEWEEFKNNKVLPSNRFVELLWSQPYEYLYRVNIILEGLAASKTISPEVKTELMGEAYFMRGFLYFYLVNTFGDVPLILDSDVRKNTDLPRTSSTEVYKTVISDLKLATNLLEVDYPGSGERTRPTKGAANLMLARAYLYTGDNIQAEIEATAVIENPNYKLYQGIEMNKTFLANSNEAIWQLQSVNTTASRNTWEGFTMTPANIAAPVAYYRLTKGTGGLVDAFELGDLRKANWTGFYTTTATPPLTHTYPYKYKVRTGSPVTEYSMVLRFAEAYLIRGEARMQQSKFQLAKEDIDVIRGRAGLGVIPIPSSIAAGMLRIEQERRVELFTEWGHRWYDLKRWKSTTGDPTKTRADDILPITKTAWKSTSILMPIPLNARKTNKNLSQNLGYPQ